MGCIRFGCGCVVSKREGAQLVGIEACEEHGGFSTVRRALGMLQTALEEAHEQLPPGPALESPVKEERRVG